MKKVYHFAVGNPHSDIYLIPQMAQLWIIYPSVTYLCKTWKNLLTSNFHNLCGHV